MIDDPKSSSKDRRRAPTRNTTKNTTTSAGTMNGDNASDPYDKDYVAQLPPPCPPLPPLPSKKTPKNKTNPPKKMKHCVIRARRRWQRSKIKINEKQCHLICDFGKGGFNQLLYKY